MSKYKTRHLNRSVHQGRITEKSKAWHFAGIPTQQLIAEGMAFEGPVPLDVAEQMLSYTPVLRKVYVEGDDGNPVPLDGRKAVVLPYDDDPDSLAFTMDQRTSYIGSNRYGIHDPKTAVLDAVIALSDAGCELITVGKLGGGRMAFTSWAPVEGRIEIPGFTTIDTYINAGTSTDGSLLTSYSPSHTLRVCDNTCISSDAAAARSGRYYAVKHTSGSVLDIHKAREATEIAIVRSRNAADDMIRMANVPITEADFYALSNRIYPLPDEEGRSRTVTLNKLGEVNRTYFTDARVPDAIHGTLLGAWQALNTQATWGFEVRGNSDPISRQWERTLTGTGAQITVKRNGKSMTVPFDPEFWAVVKDLELAPALVPAE